jgi:hypothetical protein
MLRNFIDFFWPETLSRSLYTSANWPFVESPSFDACLFKLFNVEEAACPAFAIPLKCLLGILVVIKP